MSERNNRAAYRGSVANVFFLKKSPLQETFYLTQSGYRDVRCRAKSDTLLGGEETLIEGLCRK